MQQRVLAPGRQGWLQGLEAAVMKGVGDPCYIMVHLMTSLATAGLS